MPKIYTFLNKLSTKRHNSNDAANEEKSTNKIRMGGLWHGIGSQNSELDKIGCNTQVNSL